MYAIRSYYADPIGNLTYRGTMRNFNPLVAKAADITLVDADMYVDINELALDSIVTPGAFVDKILWKKELAYERA